MEPGVAIITQKKTRTELPSCEAIDVRKVNICSIVRPVTKFKAERWFDLQSWFHLKDGTNLICIPTSKLVPTLKLVPTSKLVPLLLLKLLIDGATMKIFYQKRCDDKSNMVPNFQHEYVSNELQIWCQP